jgi:hypothetical protein
VIAQEEEEEEEEDEQCEASSVGMVPMSTPSVTSSAMARSLRLSLRLRHSNSDSLKLSQTLSLKTAWMVDGCFCLCDKVQQLPAVASSSLTQHCGTSVVLFSCCAALQITASPVWPNVAQFAAAQGLLMSAVIQGRGECRRGLRVTNVCCDSGLRGVSAQGLLMSAVIQG